MNDKRDIFLKLLLWAEFIIAARIVLFGGSVIFNRLFNKVTGFTLDDWFVTSVTIPSLFFLLASISGLCQVKFWRGFHYCVVAMTFILSGAFFNMVSQTNSSFHAAYALPAVTAVVLLVGILSLKEKSA